MFTPEQKEKKRKSPIFRYAAIGIIGLALFGASYYFGDRYVTEQQVAEQEKAQKQIKKQKHKKLKPISKKEKEIYKQYQNGLRISQREECKF